MVSKRTFEPIETVCRRLRQKNLIFGGIQVVVCGDFRQLPPVPKLIYDDGGEYSFESELFCRLLPHHVCFKQVLRQKKSDLIAAVTELCAGNPSQATDKAIMELAARPLTYERRPITILGTNTEVDIVNKEYLPGPCRRYLCKDEGNKIALKGCVAPEVLLLKKGAPVINIRNLSSVLVNGSRGTVNSIDDNPIINVDGRLHTKCIFDTYDHSNKTTLATRCQYPVKLCSAITVHRAQGMTINPLIVDCRDSFAPGHIGVAIERTTCKANLQVINYNSVARIKQPMEVKRFLAKESKLFEPDTDCCRNIIYKQPSVVDSIVSSPVGTSQQVKVYGDIAADFPFNLNEFIHSNPEFTNSQTQRQDSLLNFCRKIYAILKRNRGKNMKHQGQWAAVYKDLNAFLISAENANDIKSLWGCDAFDKTQNKFATKVVWWLYENILHQESSAV